MLNESPIKVTNQGAGIDHEGVVGVPRVEGSTAVKCQFMFIFVVEIFSESACRSRSYDNES